MRKYEGIMSEEEEHYLDMIGNMTYEESIEFDKQHPEFNKENIVDLSNIPHLDLTAEEICEKYDLVEFTHFNNNHGVKID